MLSVLSALGSLPDLLPASVWGGFVVALFLLSPSASAQQAGSIRGVVYDKDFEAPLPGAEVQVVETGDKATTSETGNYVFGEVAPGHYTLVFSKDGYVRQVKADVVVSAGQLTDADAWLSGDFTEMDEFVVQDILASGAGTEAALLELRLESPALMDSISADLMSRAGASDAASALRLVAGASIQDGKFAVIRGLPDRYVSSQMNGVRLPSADEDKRAVELDQFPSAVIESIQVSKTFTPDQQGDASGGAVDVILKGIPDEDSFSASTQVGVNDQVYDADNFLTYKGGGVNFWGKDNGDRDIQYGNIGQNWTGAAGVESGDAPINGKFEVSAGGNSELQEGLRFGGFASFYYEQKASYFDDGKNDSYWVENPGGPLVPKTFQGTPQDGDFKTSLLDVTQSSTAVRYGGLGTVGVESDRTKLNLTYLGTQNTDDTVTLAEDTRGKSYFFPGYDPNDPTGNGNKPGQLNAAPYLRTETLAYTERSTSTIQLHGEHRLEMDEIRIDDFAEIKEPTIDWTLSHSTASLDQPDKRQFGSLWLPESLNPGAPPFLPPFTTPETWLPYKPAANFTLGNYQRIWKTIDEDSNQYSVNMKVPFEQWSGDEGYLKLGVFHDKVERTYTQQSYSNFNDSGASFLGGWDEFWSASFPYENHPITPAKTDIDYDGQQEISAYYSMMDLPLTSELSLVGGARWESTHIGIQNKPEADATWYPPGASAPVDLNPGDTSADVDFNQDDLLPSIGLVYEPIDEVTLRASYSQTVARQTFKELSPVIQQEFLGGPVFVGNPDLQMSSLTNYDLRADWRPQDTSLVSVSWFRKDIEKPIEYVQKIASFDYTTAVNYPRGELNGYEVELRQGLGPLWDPLKGLSVGANATVIHSQVTLPADEQAAFSAPGIEVPTASRDMTNAPEYLYNLYLTYDLPTTGTEFALFYTVTGDTLVAGAAESSGKYVPDVYAKEFGTLNLTVSQELSERTSLKFQAKNLTNPRIETFYSSSALESDQTKTSYTRGREFSLTLSVRF